MTQMPRLSALTLIGFGLLTSLMIGSLAFGGERLDSFKNAQAAFQAGRAPTAQELTGALWMATSMASQHRGRSGSYPNGQIPSPDGAYREIAKFTTSKTARGTIIVTAKDTYTKAETGIFIDDTFHSGTLTKNGAELFAAGDSSACATRTVCRLIASGKLLCGQSNNDSRAQCSGAYAPGATAAYLGYSPVHP